MPPSSPFLWPCKSWWCDATDGYMWCIWLYTKRKYNPQGGSIPHTSFPGVASYRRQPWAIESTTPVGLSTPLAFATEWNRVDGIRYCHLPMSEMRILPTTLPFADKQICIDCSQRHNAQPNNIVSISARHSYFAQHITRELHTTLLLTNKWNRADGMRYCHLPMSEMRILPTTLPFIYKQICMNCSQHHNTLPNNIISPTNKFARIVRNIIMHYQTISYLYRLTPLFYIAHNMRIAHNIITHQYMKSHTSLRHHPPQSNEITWIVHRLLFTSVITRSLS